MSEQQAEGNEDKNLRRLGLALLILSFVVTVVLHGAVHSVPRQEPTLLDLLIGALTFLSLSGGVALVALGARIHDPVELPARQARKWSGVEASPLSRSIPAAFLAECKRFASRPFDR